MKSGPTNEKSQHSHQVNEAAPGIKRHNLPETFHFLEITLLIGLMIHNFCLQIVLLIFLKFSVRDYFKI